MNTALNFNQSAVAHLFATLPTERTTDNRRHFSAGQPIAKMNRATHETFMVEQGQILVRRNLQAIDLIEAGEPVFTELYPDAEIIARTNCV